MFLVELTPVDLLLALGLAGAAIALAAGAGLTRAWLLAIGRAFLQLTALSYGLMIALAREGNPVWLSGLGCGLLLALATAAGVQQTRSPRHWLWLAVGLGLGTAAGAAPVVLVIFKAGPDPARWLPIVGLVLAGAAQGAAIALEQWAALASSRRLEIETGLALGAPPARAIAPLARAALRGALIPALNTTASNGLFFLPPLVVGQLLAGWDALTAAGVQFVALCATALATVVAARVALWGVTRGAVDGAGYLRD